MANITVLNTTSPGSLHGLVVWRHPGQLEEVLANGRIFSYSEQSMENGPKLDVYLYISFHRVRMELNFFEMPYPIAHVMDRRTGVFVAFPSKQMWKICFGDMSSHDLT